MLLKSTHPLESCPRLKYIIRFTIRPQKKQKKQNIRAVWCGLVQVEGGWSVDVFIIVRLKRPWSTQTQIESKRRVETLTLWEINPLLVDNCAIVKKQVILNCLKYYTTIWKHYEMGYFGVVPLTRANQTDLALQHLNEMLVASNVAINGVYTTCIIVVWNQCDLITTSVFNLPQQGPSLASLIIISRRLLCQICNRLSDMPPSQQVSVINSHMHLFI